MIVKDHGMSVDTTSTSPPASDFREHCAVPGLIVAHTIRKSQLRLPFESLLASCRRLQIGAIDQLATGEDVRS